MCRQHTSEQKQRATYSESRTEPLWARRRIGGDVSLGYGIYMNIHVQAAAGGGLLYV